MWIKDKTSTIATVLILFLNQSQSCSTLNRNQIDEVQFFRNYEGKEFNLKVEPFKSDIEEITNGPIRNFIVKSNAIKQHFTQKRNYYELFYYSSINKDKTLYVLLGYYDFYYDLILVSEQNESIIDDVIIASIVEDGDNFESISTKITSDYHFQIKKRLGSYSPSSDSIRFSNEYVSNIHVNKRGKFIKDEN